MFANGPRFRFHERGHVQGEDLYAAYGRTDAGRYVTVFFLHKSDGEALIVTARDMDPKERERYGRKWQAHRPPPRIIRQY